MQGQGKPMPCQNKPNAVPRTGTGAETMLNRNVQAIVNNLEDTEDEPTRTQLKNEIADLKVILGTFLDVCPRVSDMDPMAPALSDACKDARRLMLKHISAK